MENKKITLVLINMACAAVIVFCIITICIMMGWLSVYHSPEALTGKVIEQYQENECTQQCEELKTSVLAESNFRILSNDQKIINSRAIIQI